MTRYRCGVAARWLPRTLAAAVLVAALLLLSPFDAKARRVGGPSARGLFMVAAAGVSLWILRKGGEVRQEVFVERQALCFVVGGREIRLPFKEIVAVRFEGPMGGSRSWLPAAILTDSDGRRWRLSALLAGGERLIGELLAASGRSDLVSWVEAHDIVERLALSARRVRVGYALAAGIVLAAAIHAVR